MRDFSKLHEYLNKFSQYFGNLAKAAMRSHNEKFLSKASKIFVGDNKIFNFWKFLIYALTDFN